MSPGRERRAARRRSEDRALRRVLHANADGVVVVDRDGVVCYANPAAGALFGRRPAELVGGVFGFPLAPGATTEVEVVAGPDAQVVVEMRVVETEWEKERAFLASLRDITDRRRAEEERAERIRAEVARAEAEAALRARDGFLAVAAHELKTPLTRLTLAVQRELRLQRRAGAPDAGLAETLRVVDREAAHLTRLVRQLVDAARLDGQTFELRRAAVDLRELVGAAAATARLGADGHALRLRLPRQPLEAAVDPAALQEALADVLTSAVRYSPPGTTIEVDLRRAGGRGPVPARARLVVRDHGPAAPEDVRAALAAPDRPPAGGEYHPGPSVALHVASRVAELHGGRMEVDFPEDGGMRVALTLPLE